MRCLQVYKTCTGPRALESLVAAATAAAFRPHQPQACPSEHSLSFQAGPQPPAALASAISSAAMRHADESMALSHGSMPLQTGTLHSVPSGQQQLCAQEVGSEVPSGVSSQQQLQGEGASLRGTAPGNSSQQHQQHDTGQAGVSESGQHRSNHGAADSNQEHDQVGAVLQDLRSLLQQQLRDSVLFHPQAPAAAVPPNTSAQLPAQEAQVTA